MSLLTNFISRKRKKQLDNLAEQIFVKPFTGLMLLFELIFTPLQRLIGTHRMAYLFVLPNLLIFGVFVLLPMLLNFYYGFSQGQILEGSTKESIRIDTREYVGAANLEQLLACDDYGDILTNQITSCKEDYFWRGVKNSIFYVSAHVTSMVALALLTAVALNREIRMRGFFRSVFFYPVLLSPVVVALTWGWMLDPYGLINGIIASLGGERIIFIGDPKSNDWARFWAVAISDWAFMGFYMLILLAGLQSIPQYLYEAAEIDGANAWHRFWKITMPLLMPTMTVVLVLALIRAVQQFDLIYVLTGGGLGTGTFLNVHYIYREAFGEGDGRLGLAAAASLLLASFLMVLTLVQLYFARKQEAA